MINIVIPMAGSGSRFVKAGFTKPKPFIDVAGQPMIMRVLDTLQHPQARYILLARAEHMHQESETVARMEKEYRVVFIPVNHLTEGTACTLLYARSLINNDEPLLIANSDQIVDVAIADMINDCLARNLDGTIMTFVDLEQNAKWSFARTDHSGRVVEVKEKQPISTQATVGIYLFSTGRCFVDAAIDMIIANDRVNNEFYTCPTYNYAIRNGSKIGLFPIPARAMHGLGTPEDLERYLQTLTATQHGGHGRP